MVTWTDSGKDLHWSSGTFHQPWSYLPVYLWRASLSWYLTCRDPIRRGRREGIAVSIEGLTSPNEASIDARPLYVDHRTQAGHWESDAVVSRQSKAALLVSVERKTRFSLIGKLDQKTAESTKKCLLDQLLPLPQRLTKSITYDNGSENTEHEMVNHALKDVFLLL